jgi:uncharacterized protein YcbX
MRITALHTYPVKGCRRLDHDAARVEPQGLAGDRRWIVVDPDGVGITQRGVAALSLLRVTPNVGGLTLSAPGLPDRHVTEPADGPQADIRVFRHKPPAPARLADDGDWMTAFLDRPARLAWQADTGGRPVQNNAVEGDRVSFADGYPMLLTNTASLSAVNDWLVEAGEEPVPMTRFRPNIVVTGAAPWAEDDWRGRRLRIGDVTFRAAKPCDRCLVTTIDQDTGVKGQQPLKILGRYRKFPDGLLFGMNLIPDLPEGGTPVLRVGDELAVQP